jgi:hypothetical protein
MNTFSISVRLQRITTEEYYVSVPVTGAVMADQPDADGNYHLDSAKVFDAAVELGRSASAEWVLESQEVLSHPIQKAPDAVQQELDERFGSDGPGREPR